MHRQPSEASAPRVGACPRASRGPLPPARKHGPQRPATKAQNRSPAPSFSAPLRNPPATLPCRSRHRYRPAHHASRPHTAVGQRTPGWSESSPAETCQPRATPHKRQLVLHNPEEPGSCGDAVVEDVPPGLCRLRATPDDFGQSKARIYDGNDCFMIHDFVKAHLHFSDPEWDGEPREPMGPIPLIRPIISPPEPPAGPLPPRQKCA